MSFPAKFNVTTLNGTNGFVFIDDLGKNYFGYKIANLGDINGDGKSDLIVGTFSTTSYVLFGAKRFPAKLFTSNLNGENGFRIVGESQNNDNVVSGIGDVNGDGIDDIIVGSTTTAKAYVIFGAKSFPSRFSLANLDGKNGFKIIEHLGCGLAMCGFAYADRIGDVNGDNKLDFILSYVEHTSNSSAAFVIYGSDKFPSTLDLSHLDGSNGFTIVGSFSASHGVAVAGIGDFNGDTNPDFIAGTDDMDNVYVIFGSIQFPSVVNTSLLNGSNGFTIIDLPIVAQSAAKSDDFNGDHMPDLIFGCPGVNEAFLIFGSRQFNATFDVSSIDGTNGVKLVGPFLNSGFGITMSGTSSINHNDKSGVVIGALGEGPGSAFVFFGADHFPSALHTSSLNGTNGFEIISAPRAGIGAGLTSIDNFVADRGSAIIVGAMLENTAYVIFDALIV